MKQKLQLSLDVLINEFASTFLYCLKNIFNWSLSIDLAQINMVFNTYFQEVKESNIGVFFHIFRKTKVTIP